MAFGNLNFCIRCSRHHTSLCTECTEDDMNRAAEIDRLYEVFKEQYNAEQKTQKELKLFKVTIPSQTIRTRFTNGRPPRDGRALVVGEITDYGFIQGREIVVLAANEGRLYTQCLTELGCHFEDVKLDITEIKGPFEHGAVISYSQPEGM